MEDVKEKLLNGLSVIATVAIYLFVLFGVSVVAGIDELTPDMVAIGSIMLGGSASLKFIYSAKGKAKGQNDINYLSWLKLLSFNIRSILFFAKQEEKKEWCERLTEEERQNKLYSKLQKWGISIDLYNEAIKKRKRSTLSVYIKEQDELGFIRRYVLKRLVTRGVVVKPYKMTSLSSGINYSRSYKLSDNTKWLKLLEFITWGILATAFAFFFPRLLVEFSNNWSYTVFIAGLAFASLTFQCVYSYFKSYIHETTYRVQVFKNRNEYDVDFLKFFGYPIYTDIEKVDEYEEIIKTNETKAKKNTEQNKVNGIENSQRHQTQRTETVG